MTVSDEPDTPEEHAEAARVPRRLKRRPVEMKRWIVEETFVPGASVAGVARRYGVNANQLFEWRKQYREGRLEHGKPAARPALPAIREPGLIRIGVIDHEGEVRPLPPACAGAGSAAEPSVLPPPPPLPREAAVPPHGSAAIAGRIEIELPNGIKVRVDGNADGRAYGGLASGLTSAAESRDRASSGGAPPSSGRAWTIGGGDQSGTAWRAG